MVSPELSWEFCKLLGTSTLVAGYAYLGLELPELREEIEKAVKERQMRMLNESAEAIFKKKEMFPWEKVSQYLSMEGAEDIANFYLFALDYTLPEQTKHPTSGSS